MAKFQFRARTAAGALTNAPSWGLLTNATNAVKLLELRICIGSATASEYSLGLAAAVGTQTSGVAPLNLVLGGAAGTSRIATAWSAAPTIPTNFVEGVVFPATAGSVIYWQWQDGLYIPVSSELVLWNTGAGTNAAISMFTAVLEEL
jgi:hypothetical protein